MNRTPTYWMEKFRHFKAKSATAEITLKAFEHWGNDEEVKLYNRVHKGDKNDSGKG